MRKPDQFCRVCQRRPSTSQFEDTCSHECADRLCETEYYERELKERVAELCDFEAGVYLPIYLRLARAEAQLRVLVVGVRQLSKVGNSTGSQNEHSEVAEWRETQAKADAWAVSLAKRQIKRLREKVRLLEEELREIDKRWRSLSAEKDATLKKLSVARGA